MLGAPFYNEFSQAHIKEQIIEACGDGTLCLRFVAVVDESAGQGGDQCEITAFPPEGAEVQRNAVLKFPVREPCEALSGGQNNDGSQNNGENKTLEPKPEQIGPG